MPLSSTTTTTTICSLLLLLLSFASSQNSTDYECNICGDGYFINVPRGSVEFEYNDQQYRFTCSQLQDQIVHTAALSHEFCLDELPKYTAAPCRCATADGKLKTDLFAPTPAPYENNNNDSPTASTNGNNDGSTATDGDQSDNGNDSSSSTLLRGISFTRVAALGIFLPLAAASSY